MGKQSRICSARSTSWGRSRRQGTNKPGQGLRLMAIVCLLLVGSSTQLAAQPQCADAAAGQAEGQRPRALRTGMQTLLADVARRADRAEQAHGYCVIAELMKRVGDPQAEEFYHKAIATDATNPEYNWLFGDYLRNFRGPQQPLFPEAEAQYYNALHKIATQRPASRPEETAIRARVHRSLVSLYERDGLPLFNRIDQGRPYLFLSTQNTVARLLTDIGEIDEVRDLTSEALLASSQVRERFNRPLSEDELRRIIRAKDQFDTFNRLRLRYHALPVVDVFWQYRELQDAQITRFAEPNRFNDVTLSLYGVALEKPLNLYPLVDVLLRGEVRYAQRDGLIEFLPEASEDVLSVIGKLIVSRFVGPDKANLELTVAADDIDQDVAKPIKRRVFLVAPTFRYQLFRPLRPFGDPFGRPLAPRSSEFFAGAVWNEETFGAVDVQKQDFFAGLAFKGFPGIGPTQTFDITLQATLLTAERDGTDAQGRAVAPLAHKQVHTSGVFLYRLYDRENAPDLIPPVAFVNLVLLGSHDRAVEGPSDFENFKVGGDWTQSSSSRRSKGEPPSWPRHGMSFNASTGSTGSNTCLPSTSAWVFREGQDFRLWR